MAVAKVFGRVDGAEVVLEKKGDVWSVPVPLDLDGEYVVEIMAEDDAGNLSYITKMLYTVDAGTICVHKLPAQKYIFQLQSMKHFECALQPGRFIMQRIYPVCQGVSL